MRVKWTRRAFQDYQQIYKYLCQSNPASPLAIMDNIVNACTSLESFPERGRMGRIAGSRELVLQSLPYIIVYKVGGNTVEIWRVIHVARNWS